jgi:ATP-binding cassette subfamily F protein 3
VLELKKASKGYGDQSVVSDIDLTIQRGDRFALIGLNGVGKTTLLRLMAGVLTPDSGELVLGSGVSIAYFAQQQLELLNPQQTVLESLQSVAGDMGQGRLRTLLGGFLFRNDEVDKLVSVLSGGERSRLLLCQILVQQANFLLLDEPNNHLDIQGRRVLEKALDTYEGAICLVSHDRHLINAIANKVLVLSNGRLEMFHGNYDDYQEIWQQRLQPTLPLPETESYRSETISASKKSKEKKRLEAKWRNELHRKKAPLTKRLEDLEQIIEKTSGRLDELNHLLAKPDTYENGADIAALNREYNELKKSLEEHNRQWEQTAIELETLEESFWEEKSLN